MDTLAFHKDRPLTSNVDLSGVSVRDVVSQYEGVRDLLKEVDGVVESHPEEDALWFYGMNHAMAEVGIQVDDFEPLAHFEWVVEEYYRKIQVKSLRMFYYLLLICTRESRHLKSDHKKVALYKDYPGVVSFHKSIRGSGSSTAVTKFLAANLNESMGVYTDFLVDAFNKGSYSGGYGGKEWGKIATCLREFVYGRMTAEMMMDTAFTLCHNNGSIFNKGMLFQHYSTKDIEKILDVQRSGQIPQLISQGGQFITSAMKKFHSSVTTLIPSFAGEVDWHRVVELGAMGNYYEEKAKQKKKTVNPELAGVKGKIEAYKKMLAHKKYEKEKLVFKETHFQVSKDVFVKKIDRSKS